MDEEPPFVPFYKPEGMTDEDFAYEVQQAQYRLSEWKYESEQVSSPFTQ